MYTKTYLHPMTMMKYDEGRIIGYLNEEVVPDYVPESEDPDEPQQPTFGYRYTGPSPDGGTIMSCADASDYGEVTNAIIRTRYTESEEMAIHRHHANDPSASSAEWEQYNIICEDAKAQARKWLGIDS